jgi:hypothetical protein
LLMEHLPKSYGILYTHCFFCSASLSGPVFINVPQSVSLVLKMVLIFKRLPMYLNFSKIPSTYGTMTVPWYIVSEERDAS